MEKAVSIQIQGNRLLRMRELIVIFLVFHDSIDECSNFRFPPDSVAPFFFNVVYGYQ